MEVLFLVLYNFLDIELIFMPYVALKGIFISRKMLKLMKNISNILIYYQLR
jgi:hypothetical protein